VRRIEWDPETAEVFVHDQLEGKGRHRVESRLVWAPQQRDVEVELLGGGELTTEEAWVSERFGERVPTTASVALTELELPGSIGSAFAAYNDRREVGSQRVDRRHRRGGFIGGHLVAELKSRGFERIRAVDLKPLGRWYQQHDGVENVSTDLREKDACYAAAEAATTVFNLAADMGGMGFIETHKADCMVSVLINTNLLLAARDHGVKNFMFGSSACVYAASKQTDPNVTALKEQDAYPAMPEDGYGWEKLFSERMCRHFMEDYGISVRVPRFHNVYGPFGTFAGGREKAPAAVCRKVIEAQFDGTNEIEIWGDGMQTRSFTYIDDTIEGLFRIMESEFTDPINLGSSQLVTLNGSSTSSKASRALSSSASTTSRLRRACASEQRQYAHPRAARLGALNLARGRAGEDVQLDL